MDSCILFQRKEGWLISDAVRTFGKLYLHYNNILRQLCSDDEVEEEVLLQVPPETNLDDQLKVYQRKIAIALIYRIEPMIKPLTEFTDLEAPYVHHYLSLALDPKYKELKYPFMSLHAANIHGGRQLARVYDENVILPLLARLKGVDIDEATDTATGNDEIELSEEKKATAQNNSSIECFALEGESRQQRERKLLVNELMGYRREPFDDLRDTRPSWLRANQTKYPTVILLAKHILSIPPTQIDNERIFSLAGKIASPIRSCISTKNIDNLVCLARNYPDSKLVDKDQYAYYETLEEFSDYLISIERPEEYELEA